MQTEYKLRNRESWKAALDSGFPKSIPTSSSWTGLKRIVEMMNTFSGQNLNHTMLPRGGGQDVVGVVHICQRTALALWPRKSASCRVCLICLKKASIDQRQR